MVLAKPTEIHPAFLLSLQSGRSPSPFGCPYFLLMEKQDGQRDGCPHNGHRTDDRHNSHPQGRVAVPFLLLALPASPVLLLCHNRASFSPYYDCTAPAKTVQVTLSLWKSHLPVRFSCYAKSNLLKGESAMCIKSNRRWWLIFGAASLLLLLLPGSNAPQTPPYPPNPPKMRCGRRPIC